MHATAPTSTTSPAKITQQFQSQSPSHGLGIRDAIDGAATNTTFPSYMAPAAVAAHAGLASTIPDSAATKLRASATQSQGDTQLASPGVYEKVEKGEDVTVSASLPVGGHEEGESGHINLLAAFDPETGHAGAPHHGSSSDEGGSEDEIDPISQDVRAEIFPESQRFRQPKTPITQGIKRKREAPESAPQNETPRLPVNLFTDSYRQRHVMDASQLFEATQAVTSPQVALSDRLHDRPSPNMNLLQRPSTADSLSSPARLTGSNFQRALTEPQTNYVSMKESQERRERQRQLQKQQEDLEYSSDDEFRRLSPHSKNAVERASTSRLVNGHRKSASAALTPTRLYKAQSGDRHSQPETTPQRLSGMTVNEALMISDDVVANEDDTNTTEEETEREEEYEKKDVDDDVDELAEENKENVEVPMTVGRPHQRSSQRVISQSTPSRQRQERAPPSAGRASSKGSRIVRSPVDPVAPDAEPARASQKFAIYDSQSSQRRKETQIPASSPMNPLALQSSLDSRHVILQSQYSQKPQTPTSTAGAAGSARNNKDASSQPQRILSEKTPQDDDKSSEDELSSNVNVQTQKRSSASKQLTPFPAARYDLIGEALSISPTKNQDNGPRQDIAFRQTIPNTSSSQPISSSNYQKTLSTLSDPQSSPPTSGKQRAPFQSDEKRSTTSLPFETAQETLTPSPCKVAQHKSPSKSSSTQISPFRFDRRRTLGEIVDDPSPPDQGEEIDVDFRLLSADDNEFQKTVYRNYSADPKPTIRARANNRSFKPVDEPGCTPDRPPSAEVSPLSSFNTRQPSPPRALVMSLSTDKLQERAASEMEIAVFDEAPEIADQHEEASNILSLSDQSAPENQPQGNEAIGRSTESEQVPHAHDQEMPFLAPNRVFAHFNGGNGAYYSATCIGVIAGDEPRYNVQFDDETTDTVNAHSVKRLELHPGDLIKVDLPGSRAKTFVVVGMTGRQEVDHITTSASAGLREARLPEVDVHGFTKVLVVQKPSGTFQGIPQGQRVEVPLPQTYITSTLWSNLKNREYSYAAPEPMARDGLRTPAEWPSTPSSPQSRTRRIKNSAFAPPASLAPQRSGVFQRMAFSLTNIASSTDLERAKSTILSNGGTILENGFAHLFHIPSLDRTGSPRKSDADQVFHLTAASTSKYAFTCLIADRHCRRAKYIQALALGIPCLATRWITDCVAKGRLLPWSAYLLSAGESTFLGHGAIRSRMLPDFDPMSTTLTDIVDQRPLPLQNASVLLLIRKGDEDRTEHYPLFTFAMGPAHVAKVTTVEAAVREVREAAGAVTPWDWLVVYDKEREVERALNNAEPAGAGAGAGSGNPSLSFGAPVASTSRKNRRSGGGAGTPAAMATMLGNGGPKPKVVGNEFLIQSLISGRLVDE